MEIPHLDLKLKSNSINMEIREAIQVVLKTASLTGSCFVKQFESDFSSFCNTKHAIGCGSGRDAMQLALLSADISPGDEVITTPNTFISTLAAINWCGAIPVFVDIKENDFTIDPSKIENAITEKTKVIIPLHIYGQMADMVPILKIAQKYDLIVIEDACQAYGAEYRGIRAGSIGDIACFQFCREKNSGAYGEAGAVVTNYDSLEDKTRFYLDHGLKGWNRKMDGIQGAILSVKLKHLDNWINQRIQNADQYRKKLKDLPLIVTPWCELSNRHIFHKYVIRLKRRDIILEELKHLWNSSDVTSPITDFLQKTYHNMKFNYRDFPVSEKSSKEILSLPMFPELTKNQIDFVVENLKIILENIN